MSQREGSPPPKEAMEGNGRIFISRQPICDAAEKVVGYELLFTQDHGTAGPGRPATLNASAKLIVHVFNNFGLHQVLGDRLAFLPVSSDALASDFLDLLPAERIVLEIQPGGISPPELIGISRKLRAKNFRFSLSGFSYGPQLQPLYELASYVSFDVGKETADSVLEDVKPVQHLPLKYIARNIQGYRQFHAVKGGPFALYQGACLGVPETFAMNRADPSTARVMQLFNLVLNDADIGVIEDAFKHDVALCYSLLCYINSVGFGLPYKVGSIRSAIMLLGHDFLWRWLSLLIFAGVDIHAAQRLLLNTALIRGRLTELLGQRTITQREAGHLFVVGIFSMLDTLLGIPMEQALSHLDLPDEVTVALLHRKGKYGPFLQLAVAFESNDLRGAERLCAVLGTELSTASSDHMAAIEWARQLG